MSSYPVYISNDVIPITPSDTVDLVDGVIECTGVTGTVAVRTTADFDRTYTIAAGGTLKCTVKKVYATGTTATGLVLYPM